jgi:hypothetical protein
MRYPGEDQPDDDDVEIEQDPREKGDDDGVEYADPRDEMERRILEDR